MRSAEVEDRSCDIFCFLAPKINPTVDNSGGFFRFKWKNGWSAATLEGEFSGVTNSYAGKAVARCVW